ncbi:MAG: UDP-N-acetylmuramate--L-alanine ligase [Clostridia bacterium]|nr:UDP-N-acetylmuramate--L-alanine ligase [Clostridia bacterium]
MKEFRAEDRLLDGVKHIHMIGIGGSGMSPLAQILFARGYTVTGSDVKENEQVEKLRKMGITVFIGQCAENIKGAGLVAYSAAVPQENPERVAAEQNGIPTMERAALLGAVTRCYDNVIGVCGTHGKTSVTSMITQILYLDNRQPNAVIGGKLPLVDSFCVTGDSETLVCESCEFVDSFLHFSPDLSVLLNIDDDHLDYFKTMENLENSFKKFVSMSRKCYANGDDERVRRVVGDIPSQVVTYGFDNTNDYSAANLQKGKYGFAFDVCYKGETVGHVELHVPGRHNVLNGLVSFAVCYEMGVAPQSIADALARFTGAGRRFEFIGTVDGITVADDFAHHPTEMAATLSAARDLDYGRVIVAFQPYTYSRVALLKEGMTEALRLADQVFLTPIVASREVNTYNVYSEDIAKNLPDAAVVGDYDELAKCLRDAAKPGDIILTMGAGDIFKVARKIVENG